MVNSEWLEEVSIYYSPFTIHPFSPSRREHLDDVQAAEDEGERGGADDRGDDRGQRERRAARLQAALLARREQDGERDEDGQARVVLGVLARLDGEEPRHLEGGREHEAAGEPRDEPEQHQQRPLRR